MAFRRPFVNVNGLWKELPSGDFEITGAVSFRAHKNGTNQTDLTTSGTAVKLTFGTSSFNTGNAFDNANSKFIAPAAGLVTFGGQIEFFGGSLANGDLCSVAVRKNGTDIAGPAANALTGNFGPLAYVPISVFDLAALNDYYELFATFWSGTAGNRTIQGAAGSTYWGGSFTPGS